MIGISRWSQKQNYLEFRIEIISGCGEPKRLLRRDRLQFKLRDFYLQKEMRKLFYSRSVSQKLLELSQEPNNIIQYFIQDPWKKTFRSSHIMWVLKIFLQEISKTICIGTKNKNLNLYKISSRENGKKAKEKDQIYFRRQKKSVGQEQRGSTGLE